MILSNYNFSYYSDEETFLQENKDILEKINGMKIQEVYALWNNIDGSWFLDGPMLIQFQEGILSVKVKSEKDIAIGWNDIDLNSKPIWLSQNEILGWEEDLEWKRYEKVEDAIGRRILISMTVKEELTNNLVGIQFLTEQDGLLKFIDSGDEIEGHFVNFKYEFFHKLSSLNIFSFIPFCISLSSLKFLHIFSKCSASLISFIFIFMVFDENSFK